MKLVVLHKYPRRAQIPVSTFKTMLLALALLSALPDVHDAPLPFNSTVLAPEVDLTIPGFATPCRADENCRTLWDLVWSCFLTLFACNWQAIHPNIPAPNKKRSISIFFRRIRAMLIGLLAPEMIIWAAMRQFVVAYTLSHPDGLSVCNGFRQWLKSRPTALMKWIRGIPRMFIKWILRLRPRVKAGGIAPEGIAPSEVPSDIRKLNRNIS